MGQSKIKETRKQSSLAGARADMYKFLAALFLLEPTEESVSKIANQKLISQFSEIFSKITMSPLKRFTNKYDGDFEPVKQDFHNLFLVPFNSYVTPYESVYREKLMHQQTTVKVKKSYAEASAVIEKHYFFTVDDYIGFELDFMRYLCDSEANNWDKGQKSSARKFLLLQRKFLKDHLTKWLPALSKKIEENAGTDYFKFVARITKQFVASDFKEVKEIIKEST